ncbi:hypothetical protein KAFR_0L00540 [Kazachstania africana CBS 2517]|uniref:Uncharacterized protein n=1 Tax=Kazachstania africana (strain ATCC 22294 / BCRC 22015 / CBS 2517 / CECT 1963 / NBRC 1671 / NRRL Y-8276) TaxID=1071382 RepID=H2B211_KAZAF|nr:hypothetical protein KAFR_0L00540 [Kazachstania africana CBS 2517]CCF60661.1 hypothetical protein KAFR_0L00540 [Kazachstania africana CBS 2517]
MSRHLEALRKYSACDISDGLLNLYNIAHGGYFPNLTQWSGIKRGTIAGKAYTVLFAPISDPRPEINYIDDIPPNSFIIIGLERSLQLAAAPYSTITRALFGGLMATRAQYLGTLGTAVFGRIRDLPEHKKLEYPVFSYNLGACASKGIVKPVAVNETLSIMLPDSSIENIDHDDIIVGDIHGIVRIPKKKVDLDKLINYISKSVEVDEQVADAIKNGAPAKLSQKQIRTKLKEYM